jgi:hypothetical protein
MNPTTIAHALPLRTVTFLSTLIGLPLAIVTTILTQQYERESFHYGHYWPHRRHRTRATALCFPYLGLTVTMALCIASFQRLRATGKQLPVKTAWVDALAAVLYLAVLLPIWIREVGREIRAPGLVLLISYTTVPMIINMFLHAFAFFRNLPAILPAFFSLFSRVSAPRHCPNCQASFPESTATAQVHRETATKDEGYSLLRGEDYLDEDAVAYRDARESEDLLRERSSEETAAGGVEAEDGKGKAKVIEV